MLTKNSTSNECLPAFPKRRIRWESVKANKGRPKFLAGNHLREISIGRRNDIARRLVEFACCTVFLTPTLAKRAAVLLQL